MIDSLKPAIVGVQEALIDQIGYLDSVLTDYSWIGKDRDSSDESNEYAAVFYRNNDFELLDFDTFRLNETPGIESQGWDALYNRVAIRIY